MTGHWDSPPQLSLQSVILGRTCVGVRYAVMPVCLLRICHHASKRKKRGASFRGSEQILAVGHAMSAPRGADRKNRLVVSVGHKVLVLYVCIFSVPSRPSPLPRGAAPRRGRCVAVGLVFVRKKVLQM